MKKIALFASALTVLGANAAFAFDPKGATAVPEIDALAGFAAIAVIGGVLALVRERS